VEADVESGFIVRKLLVFAAVIIVVLVIGSVARVAVVQRVSTNQNGPVFTSSYILKDTKTDDLFVIADFVQLLGNSHIEADASLIGRNRVAVSGVIDGDLTVMGNEIELSTGSQINGDAILIGNNILVNGQVTGRLHVIAEHLRIDENARLSDDTMLCAQNMTIKNVDQTLGTRQCGNDERAGWQALRDGTFVQKVLAGGKFSFSSFVFTGLFALGLAALSGLVVTIFPRRFGQMTEAIRTLPRRVSRIGCLTQIFAVALIAGLGILIAVLPPLGLILLPILALLMLPLGLLFVVGWMTMALLAGDWLLRRFARRTSPPMLTVIVGSLGLFLIWMLLGILPYGPVFSLLMVVLTGAVGLGAAIMTRGGTRSPARSYFVQG